MAKTSTPKPTPAAAPNAEPKVDGEQSDPATSQEPDFDIAGAMLAIEAKLIERLDARLADKLAEIDARSQRGSAGVAQQLEDLGIELRSELASVSKRIGDVEKSLAGVEAGVAHGRALSAEEVEAIIKVDASASFDVVADWQAKFSPQRFHRGQTLRADQVDHLRDLVGAGLKIVTSDPDRDARLAALRKVAASDAAGKHAEALRERAAREAAASLASNEAAASLASNEASDVAEPATASAPQQPKIAEGPGARPVAPQQPKIAEGPGLRGARPGRSQETPAMPKLAEGPGATRTR